MRAILAGLTVVAMGVAGGAMSLAVGSSAQWVLVDVPSLNTFVRLTNTTIEFVNDQVETDPVPLLPELHHGVGLRLSQTFGDQLRAGLHVELASSETSVQGEWTAGGASHLVDIRLEASLVSFGAEIGLVLVPDILLVTVTAGWGITRIAYRCVFPAELPTDWVLPFRPKSGDGTYTGDGPVGGAAVHLSLPLGRGVSVGVAVGFRFAAPTVPRAETAVLNLNTDGLGDVVALAGPWLGLTVRMEFGL